MKFRTRGLVAATAIVFAAQAGHAASAKDREFPVADAPVLEDRFPVQPVAFPGGVKAYRDVAYQQLPGFTPQIVDIYVPASKGPHPLVMYIHGGGWVSGHTRHSGAMADFPAALASLASEGFVVASLEYRLSGEAKFPAQFQDAKAALRFLRKNAEKYGIDPKRVGVWGGSAGGHLTALTSLACHETTLDPASTEDGCVQAAVTWYGVFDFAAIAASRTGGADDAVAKLLDCDGPCSNEKYAAASPVTYIDSKDPPFLLIHGEEDKVVPVAQSHLAETRLREAGVPVTAIYIPGVDHSFIGHTPAETRAATLKATNATFDFFHEKLGVARK
ncbi:alpha/beta hydrolase [Novosphingobium pentaromativorans]|uniref:Dienelactone hydrolase n=1 Tax=Novosphingobium pentaromativorans US6-1 TaxID=1088721 RepID=G6EG78_9SPHN|nr:alpha/beta hydrolase [Novosphingobium pentaromativorans]AIT82234.1 dienelactone hydrolase [Novosphingobium pentaromativorans US6-1]EHJ59767.1 dienelactone hydrolase [Novosphingobium pentaromativorans US6-1]